MNYYELNDSTTTTKFTRKPYKLMCLTFQHKTKRVILILHLLQNLLHNIRDFFFLISNKDVYSRTLPYAEKHKAERKKQRERKKSIKITKRKDTKYTGES